MIDPGFGLQDPNRGPNGHLLSGLVLGLVATVLLWGMILASATRTAGMGRTPPKVVWIVGEDLGPELGCYGDTNAITPNLDRLARQGVRFTRAFTHAPVCAPAVPG